MVSTEALFEARNKLTKVYENNEAVMYYAENAVYTCGHNYNLDLKAGEYIAVSKEVKADVWTVNVQNSTKGNFRRAKKAFEKYSPKMMEENKK